MISPEQALAAYDTHIAPLPVEHKPLLSALGQVLAQDVSAQTDLPPFTQSAVDGYALRSADVASASDVSPARLRLMGESAAGDARTQSIGDGETLRIFTGGRLPEGADAVARQEIVERDGDVVHLRQALPPGADTRFRGEELREGDRIAGPGSCVDPGLLAALAMAGVGEVAVRRRPRIALIVSGDEVAAAGTALTPGQIFDANGPLMTAWLARRGYEAQSPTYVRDDAGAIAQALDSALLTADLVLTSGGVSVGDRDYIPVVAERLGVQKHFWKVAQKPGKPLWFGTRGASALLAMPGNPGAVLIGLAVHAVRVLDLMQGRVPAGPLWRSGALAEAQRGDARRDGLVRMRIHDDGAGRVSLRRLGKQDSHMLSNLATADALAWVPSSETELPAGTVVRWIPL